MQQSLMDSCRECGSAISDDDQFCNECGYEFDFNGGGDDSSRIPSLSRLKDEFTYDTLVNDYGFLPGIDSKNTKRRNVIIGSAYFGILGLIVLGSIVDDDEGGENGDSDTVDVLEWLEEEQHRDEEGLDHLNAGREAFQLNRWSEAMTEFESAAEVYEALVEDALSVQNQHDTDTKTWESFDMIAQFYEKLVQASEAGYEAAFEIEVNEDPDTGYDKWDLHEDHYQESLELAEELRFELYGERREVVVDEIVHRTESFDFTVTEEATELSVEGNVLTGEYMFIILEDPDGNWVISEDIDERQSYSDSWSISDPQPGNWTVAVEPATEGSDTEAQIIISVKSVNS